MKAPLPVDPVMRSNILALADAYMKHCDLTSKTLSSYCHGDARLLEKLRTVEDASITGRKYDVVIAWFFEHWPDDLKMPKLGRLGVDRPPGSQSKKRPSAAIAATAV